MPTIISSAGRDPHARIEVKFEGVTNIQNLQIGDIIQQVQQNQIDPAERVPYSIIEIDHVGIDEALKKIVAVTNLRIYQGQNKLPFIPPIEYSKWKESDKLLLYGINGCGKTRCIYEILENRIKNKDLNRVIVICSSSEIAPDGNSAINELVTTIIQQNDLLIWDNFPDGYINSQNIQLAYNKIDQITSSKVKHLLISLKSDYLQDYLDKINELREIQTYKVVYGQDELREIILDYGKNILEGNSIQGLFAEKVVSQISWIIYNKEPTPEAIYLYFQHLTKKVLEKNLTGVDIVSIAYEFDSPSQYYKKHFDMLNSKRQYSKIYFLCTLNLCYELGLERTRRIVARLQKEIFNSDIPDNPIADLTTWIEFSSSKYYSMTGIARRAIKYPVDRKPELMDYLSDNFKEIIGSNVTTNYLFGYFFGKNIDSVTTDRPELFLPSHIYDYLKSQGIFASGLGDGLGELFFSTEDESLQERLLEMADMDNDKDRDYSSFSVRFGIHLGTKISSLKTDLQNAILKLIMNDKNFAKGISFGLGLNFKDIEDALQNFILDKINAGTNLNLQIGFSNGIRYIFTKTDKKLQNFIVNKINENMLFCIILGSSLGLILFTESDSETRSNMIGRNNWISWGIGQRYATLLGEDERNLLDEIWEIAEINNGFCDGLCYGIATTISSLSKRMKDILWIKTKENKSLSECLGFYVAENFSHINTKVQDEILNHVDDGAFGCTFVSRLGYLYNSQDIEVRMKIWHYIENEKLEYHFGFFLASNFVNTKFKNLEKELQQKIIFLKEKSKYFALGLDRGLTYYKQER